MPPLLTPGTFKKLMAVFSTAGVVANHAEHFELAAGIPCCIAAHAVGRSPLLTRYDCPQRAALNQLLTNSPHITPFDKLTIRPVNDLLERKNIPLSKQAYQAIVKDMHDSAKRPMSHVDMVQQLKTQTKNQHEIADAFAKSGETVGAIAHTFLAIGFGATHQLLQYNKQSHEAKELKFDSHDLHH